MTRTLQPEDQISHYRVVGPLGAGGMGEVYIAQDEKLERVVALKVLPPSLVRNEERVRRLITEAKSASSLNHPNIVTIYEIGQDRVRSSQGGDEADQISEPVHFISMELVSGETLSQKIHQEKTDLKTLIGYLAQAAEGIAKAHAAGIVHRDLKPGNIMVSKDGFVKVLDFGLAKLTEKHGASDEEITSATTDAGATGAGVVLGTVGYMSPEQVQAKTVDHRSDIFSMGCMLYEAATRRRPFAADTNVETMHQILKEKPRPVEELNPEAPAEVRRIIRRCLAKSPDQRFQSMKDLAIEMREVVDEYDALSVSAATASSLPSGALAAPPRTRPGLLIAIAAVAVLGIGGIGVGLYSFLGRGGPAGDAVSTLQDMKISVLMSRNDLRESILSADGRYLAFVTQAGRTSALTVRQVRTGSDVVILPMQEVQIQGISFSRDGDYLYYRDRDPNLPNYSALFQVPSLGGNPRKVFFDVDSAATFSPDGKQACFRRGLLDQAADSLVIADLETGKDKEVIRIKDPESFQTSPAWSPDGKRIVVGIQGLAEGAKAWLVAVDVESGRSARIGSKTWLNTDSVGWSPDGAAVLVSASEIGAGTAHQIYRVTYPEGKAMRMTNDLDGYVNLSLSADGSSIAAVKRSSIDNLWVAHVETAKEAEPITFATGSAGSIGQLAPLPRGALAFTASRDNKGYLWRMTASGQDRRQLTSQGIFVINAGWNERAGIVFSQVDAGEKSLAHIWRMDSDGSGLRQLTDGTGEQLTELSPAGNAVVFNRWAEPRSIWVQKLDGGEPYRIVEGEAGEGALISPDGKRVLVTKLEGTAGHVFPHRYILPLEGGAPLASFLLPPGAFDIRWTPDGKALTYVDRGEGWNVMRKSLPDGAPEPLSRFKDGQVADHRWHQDGSRMLLHRRINQQHSLWMLKPGQAEPTVITEFKTGAITRHEWAPDEPLLYFIYSTSSQDVVMITDFR